MKIAIVYDWLDKWGGVERVLLALKKVYPGADFFTSYFDKKKAIWAKILDIKKTTFIEKLPFFIRKNRLLTLPFYPFAFETFNFDKYDTVLTVTSSFAKGIITKPKTRHLCYLLTPTRFLWVMPKSYGLFGWKSKLLKPYLDYLKKWDLIVANRPEKIISISKTVTERCLKYYHLPSEVVYPPFDIDYWQKIKKKVTRKKIIKKQSFFLVVSRLEKYKRIDLVIDVFNKIGKDLVIVGKGTEEKKLENKARSNIRFYKNLTDKELAVLYTQAEALIMPQEEDFGYVSLEAQFFNCPVIAFKKGGATETVLEGKTGIFFERQNQEELIFAIERLKEIKYTLQRYLSENNKPFIKKFEFERFKKKLKRIMLV